MRLSLERLSLVAALIALPGALLPLPARAAEGDPAKTVAAFYGWYVAHHGRVEKVWHEAKGLLDSELYDEIDGTYSKDDYKPDDIVVSRCNHPRPANDCTQAVPYDFFSNASVPATSYTIGTSYAYEGQAAVEVSLRFADAKLGASRVTVLLYGDGSRYMIGNLMFEPRGYFYAGPIVDLKKFLGAYNC